MSRAGPDDAPRPIEPVRWPVDADVSLPGSKSLTNRMLLVAALAEGTSTVSGVLFADDTEAMLAAVATLGARVEVDREAGVVTLAGAPDAAGSAADDRPERVDARQSGTTSRFLLPVLAARPGTWVLDGDAQLRGRPFGDQLAALRSLGASVTDLGEPGHLPLRVSGAHLGGGVVEVRGDASSQFLSGLLLAGPLLRDPLEIVLSTSLVSRPYVELTRAAMAAFGVEVEETTQGYRVEPGRYRAADVTVEPDASAASYFFAAAAMTGGRCRVVGLGSDTLQGDLGFVDVLAAMGASVQRTSAWTEVAARRRLEGVSVDMSQISDTAPTLAAVAATADGVTEATGIGFIQAKETRRLDAAVTELRRLGVRAEVTADGFVIEGGPIGPGVVATYDDHRMAMSFALLGLVADGIAIADPSCVNKTFPRFWDALDAMRPTGPPTAAPKVVALDGPAGSGKSTVARALATALHAVHVDTGAMYRAIAYAVLQRGVDPDDEAAVTEVARAASISFGRRIVVDGADATDAIRGPDVTAVVSTTSAIPEVRTALVGLQREVAATPAGAVLEGRDIGTVVFPDAPVKFYLTARVEVRARRRFEERRGSQTLEEITADIERRDRADSSRSASPLRPAADAIMIDTSDRTVDDIVAELAAITRQAWQTREAS